MLVEGTLYISSAITNWPIVADNIYQSYKNKTGHMRPFIEAVRPLVPLVLCYLVTYLWIMVSPSNVVERDPRALFFLMGTIFSNISVSRTFQTFSSHFYSFILCQCRLIVAQMSSTRCDSFNPMFIPTILAIALSAWTGSGTLEMFLLYALCLGTSLAHIHYGTCVVSNPTF